MILKVNKYKKAGVNINEGNNFVKLIKNKVFSTHKKGAIKDLGSFAGFFDLSVLKYKNPLLISSTDGVGTKIKVAQELNKYNSLGIDLVAMCINDILVHGGNPLFFLDYIAIDKLDKKKGDFDLAGFAVGIIEKKNLITGKKIKKGDIVLGLKSSGFHSNGYSLIRYIMKKKKIGYKKRISKKINNLGEFLIKPTKIYSKVILALTKERLIDGACHITGGGITDNLPRILPKELGMDFKNSNWFLPEIFKWFKEQGDMSFDETIKVFNCGIGMVIICKPNKKNIIIKKLKKLNEPFFFLGKVVENKGKIDTNFLKKKWEY